LATKKNESLLKYEQNLLEENREKLREKNSLNFDFSENDISGKDPELVNSMNDLSKLLCNRFKESTRKITKYTQPEKDQKIKEENKRNINPKLSHLKRFLNKK